MASKNYRPNALIRPLCDRWPSTTLEEITNKEASRMPREGIPRRAFLAGSVVLGGSIAVTPFLDAKADDQAPALPIPDFFGCVTRNGSARRISARNLANSESTRGSVVIELEPGGTVWGSQDSDLRLFQEGDELLAFGHWEGPATFKATDVSAPLYSVVSTVRSIDNSRLVTMAGTVRFDRTTRPVAETPYNAVAHSNVKPGNEMFALVRANRVSGEYFAVQLGAR
ncbi:MAG: hypothetical protein ACRDZ7_05285 [Acidimicrobiia bacterium]